MSLLCLSGRYDQLYTYATFFVILAYAATGIALFVFRRRRPDLARPYRCWGYPVVPVRLRRELGPARGQHRARAAEGDAGRDRDPAARPAGLLPDAPRAPGGRREARPGRFFPSRPSWRAAGPAPSPSLTGFTPKRSAWQREYERRLLDAPAAGGVRGDPPRSDADAARRRDRWQRARRRVPRGRVPQGRLVGRDADLRSPALLPEKRAARDRRRAGRGPRPGRAADRRRIPTRTCPRRRSRGTPTRRRRRSRRGRLRQPWERRGLRPAGENGHRRPRQDRPRPLFRRLPRRQVARSREAWRTGDPRLFGSDRRRLVPGPGLSRRPVGAGLAHPAGLRRL